MLFNNDHVYLTRTCFHRQMPTRLLPDLGPVYSYLFGPLALEVALISEIDRLSAVHQHSRNVQDCTMSLEGCGKQG